MAQICTACCHKTANSGQLWYDLIRLLHLPNMGTFSIQSCTSVSSQVNKADTAWFSSTHSKEGFFTRSKSSESSTHYLNDTIRFNVLSKGPSSGINVGGREQARVFLYK